MLKRQMRHLVTNHPKARVIAIENREEEVAVEVEDTHLGHLHTFLAQ